MAKNFAETKIRIHDIPNHFMPQPLFSITVVWPFSDLTSLTPSGCQCSGGPSSHFSHHYGHWQTGQEPVYPEREGANGRHGRDQLMGPWSQQKSSRDESRSTQGAVLISMIEEFQDEGPRGTSRKVKKVEKNHDFLDFLESLTIKESSGPRSWFKIEIEDILTYQSW